ncbi:LysM peptidoglycan-binding domain-containing protein [Arcticibacter sp.]|uniref:LysM peptidoglycan-binding domain-containing protein n=1 Tax=Arcticibacter sp. TaxID=1872630 RepID=UPI00388F8DEF
MRFILASVCIFVSGGVFANSRLDSVGRENNNGKLVIIHSVNPKESYYSIGRLYKVAAKDIQSFNKVQILRPGSLVKVPTERPFVSVLPAVNQATSAQKQDDGLVDYKVGPKETLFAIARRFNTHVESIKQLNNLKGNGLAVGQVIKVKPGAGAPLPPVETVLEVAKSDSDRVIPQMPVNRYGLKEKTEKGIATWISDENLDSSKMLALHKTAPVGTVVRISNPMTGKTTFAKVVGKYTENTTTKDVIIVITQATADLLGVLDKRFLVTIDYGVPNE